VSTALHCKAGQEKIFVFIYQCKFKCLEKLLFIHFFWQTYAINIFIVTTEHTMKTHNTVVWLILSEGYRRYRRYKLTVSFCRLNRIIVEPVGFIPVELQYWNHHSGSRQRTLVIYLYCALLRNLPIFFSW